MRISTQINKRDAARSKIRDGISSVKHFGLPHADLLNVRDSAFSLVAKCPGNVKAYLEGYFDAMAKTEIDSILVYGGFFDGKFYSSHKNRSDYYGNTFTPADWSQWSHNGNVKDLGLYIPNASGELKPYFISERKE